jgi:hypothetical protein
MYKMSDDAAFFVPTAPSGGPSGRAAPFRH